MSIINNKILIFGGDLINKNKWNIDTAKQLFTDNGLILDEITYINTVTRMKCHDKNEYCYLTTVDNLRSNKYPQKYHMQNPFSLYNMKNYIKQNGCNSEILSTKYNNSKSKISIKCECGNIFEVMCSELVKGKIYCNHCSKSKRYDGKVDYTKLIYDECNNRDYTLITDYIHRSNSQFYYICNKHSNKGYQTSNYDRFINLNQGCKYCGIEKRGAKHRKSEDYYKKIAEEKGFDYISVDYNERNNGNKKANLHLICRKHKDKGIQILDLYNLKSNKNGCIYCNGQGRTKESFQAELKGKNLNVEIIEFNNYNNLDVKCIKCGYMWNTYGTNLLYGHGCPICKSSKGERKVETFLKKFEYKYIAQYTYDDCRDILPLPFDFYLPEYNILIEVDGEQHFYPISFGCKSKEKTLANFHKQLSHDKIKNEYCKKHNIPLIRIPYYEIQDDNMEYFLFDMLKKYHAII